VTHPDHATTDCEHCPLRKLRVFQPLTPAEVEFMRGFKAGELTVAPHTTILLQGSTSPQLFTALSGWGLRYKLLPEGQRQVINFVMPGDLVGLQAGLLGEMQHCVESVTHMKLCVFPRAELMGLFRTMPERGSTSPGSPRARSISSATCWRRWASAAASSASPGAF
jgi:CRP/FNR family transcriptional regulator, anaerobic regulatory protein